MSLNKFGEKILKLINISIIKKYQIKLIDSNVQAGSGSLPIENIESKAIIFGNSIIKASNLSKILRKQFKPVIGYIKSNIFHIDLKAIPEKQLSELVESINNVLK